MDAADETPQREKKRHVDGDSPTQVVALAVTKVLDDDNLLREIIVRVGFPTTLVRAALVCKRWLGHASDPKFLSRFRKLHPPRLLGYYITEEPISLNLNDIDTTHFVPMLPQPPELSDVIRNLESYNFRSHRIMHCQDGTIFTWRREGESWTHEVHHPLCYQRRTQILPPLPPMQDQSSPMFSGFLSKEGSIMSYLYVSGESVEETKEFTVRVYMLQDGEWCMDTLATCPRGMHLYPTAVHYVHNKIYLPSNRDEIIILDLTALSYSTIQLPQGVKEHHSLESLLSRADDTSSVYLSHVKEFQLRIWLHKGDNWLLVDTICLREMFSTLGMSGHTLENEGIANVLIRQVGDNAQFVILQMGDCIFYLDIKCRTLRKVYENKMNDRDILSAHSFMMIWPPTFPALKDDPARELLDGQ